MKIDINNIYLGDTRELIKNIPDETIDCIVSDIPYKLVAGGVSVEKKPNEPNGVLSRRVKSDGSRIGNKWLKKNGGIPSAVKQGKMFSHNDIEFNEYLPELYRVLKKGTHCYLMINGRNLADLQKEAEKAGFVFQNLLCWIKNNVTPTQYYMQGVEFILMLSKRPARAINNRGTKNYFIIDNIIGNKLHPTQKPVELMKILIENSTDEGDTVLDPFAGSGSTLIAAIQSKRNYIGFEIDEEYYNITKQRIKETDGKTGLFADL